MSQEKAGHKKPVKHTAGRLKFLALFAVGGLLLVGAIALAASFSGAGKKPSFVAEIKGAPSLKVDKEKVDLGDVKLDTQERVTFQITNVGDQPLKFVGAPYTELKAGC